MRVAALALIAFLSTTFQGHATSVVPTIWQDLGAEGAIRRLIETEIAALPREVGPPIAIAVIDANGPRRLSEAHALPNKTTAKKQMMA
jgi:hypothetical protein